VATMSCVSWLNAVKLNSHFFLIWLASSC
jgi:hypothetical protein